MDLAPGMMVTPNVRLVELLGTGGMGSVWLADHLGLEARVAVKFLSGDLVAIEPNLTQRFKREASICARLRSIHVVQTFDHGTMEDGAPYIVMELLEGATLTQMVERDGPLAPRLAAMLVAQVVKVLHRAHVLGIVHRDIKPDNIFITEDSDYELFVKVLDFGIAKQKRIGSAPVTATGVVVGTPEFMSPEQAISSKNIDYRSDLFSLGVVAFYAITGELPFDGASDEPLWMQMSAGKMRSARTYRPELPPEIDMWFVHALEARPEDRFQSARTMADALAMIVDPQDAHQIVDELSEVDGPRFSAPEDRPGHQEDSQPAMYELLGPESEECFSEATAIMGEADHLAAEDDEPPTQRRPRVQRDANVASVRMAVAAGVYNAGVEGAYNGRVSPTLIDNAMASEPPVASDGGAVSFQASSEPEPSAAFEDEVSVIERIPPTVNMRPSLVGTPSRRRAVLAAFGAAALIATTAVVVWWQWL